MFRECKQVAGDAIPLSHIVPHQTQPTIGTAANLHFVASLRDATRPQEFTGVNERDADAFRAATES